MSQAIGYRRRRALRATTRRRAHGPRPQRLRLEWLEPRTLLAAGDLDQSFGTGGLVTADLSSGESLEEAFDLVEVGADNKIVVVGNMGNSLAMVRYHADGTRDTSFGVDGRVIASLPGGELDVEALAVRDDGRLVVVGDFDPSGVTPSNIFVASFASDGDMDTTFDGDGWVTTDFGTTSDAALDVAIDGDGRIVVAGYSFSNYANANFALARYLADGRLDTTFSGDGLLTTDFGGADFATGLLIDGAGRIVVAGQTNPPGADYCDFAVARYDSTGALDATFSGDGRATVDFGGSADYAVDVALDADSRIVVAGYTDGDIVPADGSGDTGYDFAVARFTSDGVLDPSFSGDGKATTDVGGSYDCAEAVAVDTESKILVVGYATDSETEDSYYGLLRYNGDGSLDGTFGVGGRVITDFGSNIQQAHSVRLAADNNILVAGVFRSETTGYDFALLRYHGTLPAPWIAQHTPDGALFGQVSAVRLTFNEPMDAASFALAADIAAFQGPNGSIAASAFRWLAPEELEISFAPQTTAGDYRLILGPQILDADGLPLNQDKDSAAGEPVEDQYQAAFTILPAPPRVTSHGPAEIVAAPVDKLRIHFDQTMNPASFAVADDVISFAGPDGAVTVADSQWLDEDTLELRFAPQRRPGTYELVLGSGITSAAGFNLDQDEDLTPGEPVEDRYQASFTIDQPPRVVGQRPSGAVAGPVSTLQLDFSRPMDPASFQASEDVLSFTGPGGDVAVLGAHWLDSDTLELNCAELRAPGAYQLTLGAHVRTPAGSPLDQDNDLVAGEETEDRYAAAFDIASGPWIVGHAPSGDQVLPVAEMRVTFNEAIDGTRFRGEDISIQGPAGPIEVQGDPLFLGGNEYRIRFAQQTAYGVYHVYVGPQIQNYAGLLMDQDRDGVAAEPTEDRYDATFTLLDITGPQVTAHAPTRPVNISLSQVDFSFDEAIAAGSFLPSDVLIVGPAGAIAASDVQPLSTQQFRVTFPAQLAAGAYRVTVGPGVADLVGNLMDQDRDGDKGEAGDDAYTAEFVIDLTPPHVASHAPEGVQSVPVRSLELCFDEAIDAATFTPAAVAITGPAGAVAATAVTQLDAARFRIDFPATVRDGAFSVAIAPVVADLAGNPLAAPGYGFQFTQALPDLIVRDVVLPAECLAGQEVDVSWTVANAGAGAALGVWRDVLFLSADNASGGDQQLIQLSYDAGGLAPGASYTRTATVQIPADAAGNRWIVATTDQQLEVAEPAEANNTTVGASALWITTRPYPDLRVADITAPLTLPADETASISWTVRNLGTGPTSARYWFDAVYLSTDDVLDASDRQLAEFRNPDFLGAGEQYTRIVDVPIPDQVARGQYYLLVKTDCADTEEEFDLEGNNVASSPSTTEVITPAPGFLEVVSVDGPDTAEPRGIIDFTWTIRNTGGAKIYPGWSGGYWDDAVALSRDPVFSEDDFWMGGHLIHHTDPLLPGETRECHVVWPPDPLPKWAPGDYYLILVPDNHQIALTQGALVGRNYAVTPITLAYPDPPDLAVSAVVAPTAAVAGQMAEFTWTVTNQGAGTTGYESWHDDVYLSTDRTLDPGDYRVGSRSYRGELSPEHPPAFPDNDDQTGGNVGPLHPTSYVATASLRIPQGWAGDYYVIVKAEAGEDLPDANWTNNVLADDLVMPITVIQSDLRPTIDIAPATGRAGQTIHVQWTVANQGSDATAVNSWYDAWYLSADTTLDPVADEHLFTHHYGGGALAPGGSYQRSADIVLPVATEGAFRLLLATDYGEDLYEHQGEENNVVAAAQPLTIADLAADLEVSDFAGPAGPYIAGRGIELTWRVRNNGAAATSADWQDALYLSADAVLDVKQDRLIRTFPHAAGLGVGDQYGGPATVTVPDGLAGSYYFLYAADSGQRIYEKGSDANNVTGFGPVEIVDLKPDLRVENGATDAAGTAGQFLNVYFTVANRGEEPARGPWYDALYLSKNDVFNPDPFGEADSLFAVFPHAADAAVNEQYGPSTIPAAVRLPDRAAGQYRIFLVPDYTNGVDELNNGDAYLFPTPLQVTLLPPDLRVTAVAAPTAASAGTPLQISWTVRNEGIQWTAESSWQDGVYLSADDILDPAGDIELGVLPHTGILNPADEYSVSAWFTLRQDLQGPYRVYVATDVRRQVFEHDLDANNTTAAPVLLDVAGVHADLQVAVAAAPETAPMGGAVQVQWTVTNTGRDATAAICWTDAVYLSSDAALDSGDRLLATVLRDGALASLAAYQRSVGVRIPADEPGDYYVLVKTDSAARNDVYEFQAEDNNVAAARLAVVHAPTPDLQVTEVLAPAEAWSAQNVHIEWLVHNHGGADAVSEFGGWFDSVYLSRDPYLDRDADIFLGPVSRAGVLAAGAGYSTRQAIDARLPAGISGPYYVLVVADSNNRIFERAAESNNIGAALGVLKVKLTPPADLQVTAVTAPTPTVYGELADWSYEVTNLDTLDAEGAWVDTIYLSADNVWDLSDPRIGRVTHDGDVPHGQSYSETLRAAVPGVLPGEYYVIVRTDILNQLRELDDGNNTGVSQTTFRVLGRGLEYGVPTTGNLAPSQAAYFELPVGYLEDVRVTVSGAAAATAELFVAHGTMLTRADYDERSAGSPTQDPQVRLTSTQPGTVYLLVHGDRASGSLSYQITAELLAPAVTGVAPPSGGNTGAVTLYFAGQSLPPAPTVELIAPSGDSVAAMEVFDASPTGFYATFGLSGAQPGLYDVRVLAEGAPEILAPDLFTVLEGAKGKLEAKLVVPALVRRNAPFSFSVEYANTGGADLVSPLLRVSGPAQLRFGLAPGEYSSSGSMQFLAHSSTGPAGVLQPGDREVLTIYCSGISGAATDLELTAIEVDPYAATIEPIDWESLEGAYRPAFLTAEEWAPQWQVFTHEVGGTWPEVVECLARLATADPSQSFLAEDLMQRAFESLTLSAGGGLTDFDPPYVLSGMPVVPTTGVVTGVDLIFSEAIDGATLNADTLDIQDPSGNSLEPTAIEARGDRLWRVSFAPQTAHGLYHAYVGPNVTDTVGQALDQDSDDNFGEAGDDQYDAQFWISDNSPAVSRTTAPFVPQQAAGENGAALTNQTNPAPPATRVTGHSPTTPIDARKGFSEVLVYFSAPINGSRFFGDLVTITGPDGNTFKARHTLFRSSTSYVVVFPEQTKEGTYHFAIDPHVRDRNLEYLDGNNNGIRGEAGDGASFEVEVKELSGPYVVKVTPEGVVGSGLREIEVTFSEALEIATIGTHNLTNLQGPANSFTVASVFRVDDRTVKYRLDTNGQAGLRTSGEYSFLIGAGITDKNGNAINQDQDETNGEAEDRRRVQLQVRTQDLVVTGQVKFAGHLKTVFPNGANATVQLWEMQGFKDPVPGQPQGTDAADILVSRHNTLSGYERGSEHEGLVNADCRFAFMYDLDGNPIQNVDPAGDGTSRDLYVVALAKNEFAYAIDEATIGTTALSGPLDASVRADKGWYGRYYFRTSDVQWPQGTVGPNANEEVSIDVVLPDNLNTTHQGVATRGTAFGLTQWVHYGANWIKTEVGETPRRALALVYPYTRNNLWGTDANGNPKADPDNAAYWGDSYDLITIGRNELVDPATVLHEYGHAVQYALNSYASPPRTMGGDVYAMIQLSASENTPFSEAWASFFAAKTLERHYPDNITIKNTATNADVQVPLLNSISQNRANPTFLENNDYWRAYGAYGRAGNAGNGDSQITAAQLPNAYLADGIHPTGQQGNRVMGAIMSIFWDLADGGKSDDDHVNDLGGLWKAFKKSAGANTLAAFYQALGDDRAVQAIFLDQGVAVADDALEDAGYFWSWPAGYHQNDDQDHPTTLHDKIPFEKSGLIVADPAINTGDWYIFRLPATAGQTDPEQKYGLNFSIYFDVGYGDLDLYVKVYQENAEDRVAYEGTIGTRGTGRAPDDAEYAAKGGYRSQRIRETVRVENLSNRTAYLVEVAAAGRGALSPPRLCGDMHPDYSLVVSGHIPEPPRTDNVKGVATAATTGNRDPNDKVNAGGFSESLYVAADALLPYTIHFENVPEATAPVVLLTVTDQLDADLDWSTFELGDMEFGHHLVDVPAGLTDFQRRIDLRPEGNQLLVDVAAAFDRTTGLITWSFTAIDPDTGEFTMDPLAGFLPPNLENHDGEGFVSYTVRPQAGLPSGAEITNAATIIFDWNEPLDTPRVANIIDGGSPRSSVQSLPPQSGDEDFPVHWLGNDEAGGSGIHSYNVYVSDNGGPYTRWLTHTTSTHGTYTGQFGHTYAFHSTAIDNVSHVESAAAGAEAETIVTPWPWQNFHQRYDVNDDGRIVPLDALLIINELNDPQHHDATGRLNLPLPSGQFVAYYDVAADALITPLDVLHVINYLNGQTGGEGELASRAVDAAPFMEDSDTPPAPMNHLAVVRKEEERLPPPLPFPVEIAPLAHRLRGSTCSLAPVSGEEDGTGTCPLAPVSGEIVQLSSRLSSSTCPLAPVLRGEGRVRGVGTIASTRTPDARCRVFADEELDDLLLESIFPDVEDPTW